MSTFKVAWLHCRRGKRHLCSWATRGLSGGQNPPIGSRGGPLEFTQAEAEQKAKDRQWVRIRDGWFEDEGVPKDTRGQVIGADPLGGVDPATNQDIWVVHIRFHSEDLLILNIGLHRYMESFVEIAADKR